MLSDENVEFVADAVVKIDQLSADIEITDITEHRLYSQRRALCFTQGYFTLKFIDEDTAAGRTQRLG